MNIRKMWITTGILLLLAGLSIFAGATAAMKFDFRKLSNAKYETNTYKIDRDFDKISIDADSAKIDFELSEDGQCKIVCYENEKVKHTARVRDGVLSIEQTDNRKWFDFIGFSIGEAEIEVYLPREKYASLTVKGGTGDIEIPEDFSFKTADISAATGDVEYCADTSGLLKISLTTGNITVEGISAENLDLTATTGRVTVSSVSCKEDIEVDVSTGKVEFSDISCKNLINNGTTGVLTLSDVIAFDSISAERSTGDISFDNCDASEIYVKTSTGSVTGTLLSEKIFITKTNTGKISVPKTTTGGICEIETSTGNIKVDIK